MKSLLDFLLCQTGALDFSSLKMFSPSLFQAIEIHDPELQQHGRLPEEGQPRVHESSLSISEQEAAGLTTRRIQALDVRAAFVQVKKLK